MSRCLALVVVLLSSVMAGADDLGLVLDWRAPAACPDVSSVVRAVQELAGRRLKDAGLLEARATVTSGEAGRWSLLLETVQGGVRGQRVLGADSCGALVDSAALILALMLNPAAQGPSAKAPPVASAPVSPRETRRPSEPRRAAESQPERTPVPEPLPSAPPAPPEPLKPPQVRAEQRPAPTPLLVEASPPPVSSPSRRHLLAASVRWSPAAVLPADSWGVGAFAATRQNRLRLEAGLGFWLPQRRSLDERPTAGGDFFIGSAELRACWAVLPRRLAVLAILTCGGADVGGHRARSFGVQSPDTVWTPWLAASGGILTSFDAGSGFGLGFRAQALAALSRPRFVLEGLGVVHQPSRAAVSVALEVARVF